MKLTKREKVLLVILGVVLGGFLYYRFVFTHENETIAKLQIQYNNVLALKAEAENSSSVIDEITSKAKKISDEIAEKTAKVSAPIRVPDVLNELDTQAAAYQLLIENIKFEGDASPIKGEYSEPKAGDDPVVQKKATEPTTGLHTLTVSFSFTGAYEDCLRLIRYYENNQRLFIVDTFQMEKNGNDCSGDISLRTFSVAADEDDFMYRQ